MKYILSRLKERSTWVGLSLIATGLGVHLDPEHMARAVELGCELAGVVFIITKDINSK